jgi:hypothetical protein
LAAVALESFALELVLVESLALGLVVDDAAVVVADEPELVVAADEADVVVAAPSLATSAPVFPPAALIARPPTIAARPATLAAPVARRARRAGWGRRRRVGVWSVSIRRMVRHEPGSHLDAPWELRAHLGIVPPPLGQRSSAHVACVRLRRRRPGSTRRLE